MNGVSKTTLETMITLCTGWRKTKEFFVLTIQTEQR